MIPWALILKLWPYLAGALAAVALILVALHIKGELDSIPGLKADAANWKSAYQSEQKAFQGSEDQRKRDQIQAVSAVNASNADCDARISEARRSSSAIRSIVNVCPKLDQQNCPVRSVIDPGGLRNALGAHG